jgi:hypothetical protein
MMTKKMNPLAAPAKKKSKSPAANVTPIKKKLKLSRKERAEVEMALIEFGETVWQAEHYSGLHPYRPRSSYFPSPMIQSILDGLMKIHTMEVLATHSASWAHHSGHSAALLDVITHLRIKFTDA